MFLMFCRYLALVYAIGLAVVEAVVNMSKPQWQFAPLWIIDYVIVVYLLAGFWATRRGHRVPVLMSAYALSAGVMYMALFVALEPEVRAVFHPEPVILTLIGLVVGSSVVGLAGTTAVWWRQDRGSGIG